MTAEGLDEVAFAVKVVADVVVGWMAGWMAVVDSVGDVVGLVKIACVSGGGDGLLAGADWAATAGTAFTDGEDDWTDAAATEGCGVCACCWLEPSNVL